MPCGWFLPFLPLFVAGAVNAQLNYMYSFGGSGSEYGYDLAVRADGQYAIAGQTQTAAYTFGSCDGFIAMVQPNGMLASAAAVGGTSCERLFAIEALPDTGAFLIGNTLSFGIGSYDAIVIRTNKNNGVVWSRTVGSANYEQVFSSALTHDGGVVIAGAYGTTSSNADPWIAKLSSTGTLIWSTVLNAPFSDQFYHVERTSDNGFIATGRSSSFAGTGPDVIVAKFSSTGVLQWHRGIISPSNDVGQGAMEVQGGGFVVTGFTYSYGAGSNDVFLCKFDVAGNLLWYRTYGDANYNDGLGLLQLANGDIVVAGTASHGLFTNDNIMLIKTDAAGNLIWSKEFGRASRMETGHAVKLAPDGGLVVTGEVWNCPGNTFEALLLKTQASGGCPNCDSLIVNYSSTTETPSTATVFSTASGGVSNPASPMIGTLMPNMTLCSMASILPIELLYFKGDARHGLNALQWSTATELNNERFDLERSANGLEFHHIGSLPGAGNSSQTLTYELFDQHPLDLGYYRLKQVDHDGAYHYSDVVAIENHAASDFLVVQGPAALDASVRLPDGAQNLYVIDAVGRVIQHRNVSNTNSATVHFPAPGIFFIRVDGYNAATKKVMVQR